MARQRIPELDPYIVPDEDITPTGKEIGKGAYGSVEEVEIPGAVCAAKKLHDGLIQLGSDYQVHQWVTSFVNECKLASKLRHPNIVQFLGVCYLPGSNLPVLLMEKLLTSLHDLLEENKDIPFDIKVSILIGVDCGLVFLHSRVPPIAHRDLSARNILLDSALTAKIADLGVARMVNIQPGKLAATMTQGPGNIIYMPPEAVGKEGTKYNTAIDVFSFGNVALFTLTQVFQDNLLAPTYFNSTTRVLVARTEIERRVEYLNILYQVHGKDHPLVLLVLRCLEYLPEDRPSASEVLEHLKEVQSHTAQEWDMTKLELVRSIEEARKQQSSEEHKRQLSEKQELIDENQRQIDQLQSEVLQQQQLQEELTQKQNDVDLLRHETSQHISQLQEEVSQKQKDINQLQDTVHLKDQQVNQLRVSVSEKEEQVRGLLELTTLQQQQLEAQRTQIEAQSTDIKTQRTQIEAQSTDIKTQRTQIEAQSTYIKTQRTQIEAQRTEIEAQSTDIETQRTQIEAQSTDIKTQRTQIEAQRTEIEAQCTEIEAQSTEIEAQSTDIEAQSTEINPPEHTEIETKRTEINPPEHTEIETKRTEIKPPERTEIETKRTEINPPERTEIETKRTEIKAPERTEIINPKCIEAKRDLIYTPKVPNVRITDQPKTLAIRQTGARSSFEPPVLKEEEPKVKPRNTSKQVVSRVTFDWRSYNVKLFDYQYFEEFPDIHYSIIHQKLDLPLVVLDGKVYTRGCDVVMEYKPEEKDLDDTLPVWDHKYFTIAALNQSLVCVSGYSISYNYDLDDCTSSERICVFVWNNDLHDWIDEYPECPLYDNCFFPTVVTYRHYLIIVGGYKKEVPQGNFYQRSVTILDSEKREWYIGTSLPVVDNYNPVIIEDTLYLVGRKDRHFLQANLSEPFNSLKWVSLPQVPVPNYSSVVANGNILTFDEDSVHLFSPHTNQWKRAGDFLPDCLACVMLPSDELLAVEVHSVKIAKMTFQTETRPMPEQESGPKPAQKKSLWSLFSRK